MKNPFNKFRELFTSRVKKLCDIINPYKEKNTDIKPEANTQPQFFSKFRETNPFGYKSHRLPKVDQISKMVAKKKAKNRKRNRIAGKSRKINFKFTEYGN